MKDQAKNNRINSKYLDWDSGFLGFPVFEFRLQRVSDLIALPFNLEKGREEGARLIYVNMDTHLDMPPRILSLYGGIAVDQKITFRQTLNSTDNNLGSKSKKFKIQQKAGSLPRQYYEQLRNLCWEAGKFSRFKMDERLSDQKFKELYDVWLMRSLKGELAKEVWVSENNSGNPIGFVTLDIKRSKGVIGLISVSPEVRGKGLGTELVDSAIRSMKKWGARCAEVVTQLENAAACNLYSRCGFTKKEQINRFHFWL